MSVRDFFSSPRRRRRALRLAVVLLIALAVALLIAFDRNTVGASKDDRLSSQPATVYKAEKQVRLPRSDYYKARDVAIAFIRTAVERKSLAKSCGLVTRKMMQGMTCHQWRTQDIPVVPYDPDERISKYSFDYSFPTSVGIKFALYPKAGDRVPPTVFRIDLERRNRHARWLVDDWQPAGLPPQLSGGNSFSDTGSGPTLGARWLLLPLGIVLALLLVPVGIGLRAWRRGRRAARAYPAGPLPPLRS